MKNEGMNQEQEQRIKLAALCKIMHKFDWTDLILNHVSAKLASEDAIQYLFNPFGLLYEEVDVLSLIKVAADGTPSPDNAYACNPAGFVIHGAIYEARPDIGCIIHTHTPYGMAVSNLKHGLLCSDQMSMMFHQNIGYHDFEGIAVDEQEKASLVEDLASNSCLILRNHGLLATGRTIEEAFFHYYYLELACKTQILTLSSGQEVNVVPADIKDKTLQQHMQFNHKAGLVNADYPNNAVLAFEALCRVIN
jgi:ribulose-5-phosphate 4-epimerase/fuculose-1-phosphate aldolase